jgi:hypothetical protein
MMPGAEQAVAHDRLGDALRLAPALGPELFNKIIDRGGTRLRVLRQSGKAFRIDRLIEAGAWTEAALALIELEIPAWKVRRLVCENGEWLCSLSRQLNVPIELDDNVEASHEVLARWQSSERWLRRAEGASLHRKPSRGFLRCGRRRIE